MQPSINKINATENELNDLFREALDGVRDDLIETSENTQIYLDAIENDPVGKELYGPLYNDALKIKGAARLRQLSFLNMFKDRVSKKEVLASQQKEKTGSEVTFTHGDMNDLVAQLRNRDNENIPVSLDDFDVNDEDNDQ